MIERPSCSARRPFPREPDLDLGLEELEPDREVLDGDGRYGDRLGQELVVTTSVSPASSSRRSIQKPVALPREGRGLPGRLAPTVQGSFDARPWKPCWTPSTSQRLPAFGAIASRHGTRPSRPVPRDRRAAAVRWQTADGPGADGR